MAATTNMTNEFVKNVDITEWSQAIRTYKKVLQRKAETKSKQSAISELIELDKWYQEDLSKDIHDRKEKYITHPELVKLMKWKLSRGKFRPRLVQLADSNLSQDVEEQSQKAFSFLAEGNLKAAVEHLCKLKGIGPATASAVLAVGSPDKAAFMADEAVLGVLGNGPLKYTLAEYLEYMDGIEKCVKQLKKKDPSGEWNSHSVELAVWAHWWMHKLELSVSELIEDGPKRKSDTQTKKSSKKIKK